MITEKRRVLVTGLTGFMGAHVAERLRSAGAHVTGLGRGGPPPWADDWIAADLTRGDWSAILEESGCDTVINLAGIIGEPGDAAGRKLQFAINHDLPARLFEAVASRERPTRIVLVASAAIYAPMEAATEAIDESHPMRPAGFYGQSKAAMVMRAEVWRRRGLDIVTAIPFNVIGPGQSPALVPAAFIEKLRKDPAQIRTGNLDGIRDWIDVRDVSDALVRLTAADVAPGLYNVSSGQGRTVREILDRLIRIMDCTPTIQSDAEPGGVSRSVGNSSKLGQATGWQINCPLDRALEDMLLYTQSL